MSDFESDGAGCHAGSSKLAEAAKAAGNSDLLEKYKKDFKYVELEDADHFSDTLFYDHKKEFYTELLSWFDNKCGLK